MSGPGDLPGGPGEDPPDPEPPEDLPTFEEVQAHAGEPLSPDRVYCTRPTCKEWRQCLKKHFRFVRRYCKLLW